MTLDLSPALAYLDGAQAILDRIRATQLESIGAARWGWQQTQQH